jgi:hypothetical protein
VSIKKPNPDGSAAPAASETLLTPRETAGHLKLSTSWLAKQRLKGGGPPYLKLDGAVRYRVSDLQLWMKARLRLSTSGL